MSQAADLGFHHRFLDRAPSGDGVTLLLLHGTGGDESSLISLGQALAPGAAILSPRGRVLENGMPRFFRRLAEGVFDLEDLKLQTGAMAGFVQSASVQYNLQTDRIVAVGYSNGANIASSVMFTHPSLLAAAVLLRPMVPFVPAAPPDLGGRKVFIAGGKHDGMAGPPETGRLTGIFESAGALVTTHWHEGGHELGQDDVDAASRWLADWRAGAAAIAR